MSARRANERLRTDSGVTLIDLFIVVAVLALLAMVLLPALYRPTARAPRIHCVNNLKQIGLAARMWSNDHTQFPWNVPMSSNGVKEIALSGDVAALFRSMSNELSSAKILYCPSDGARTRETNFTKLNNKNISYFIGLDADETKRQTILSGDRNISGGLLISNRIMEVRATNVLVWGADIHGHFGNMGLSDGSVQQVNDVGLQKQVAAHLQSQTNLQSRFAMP